MGWSQKFHVQLTGACQESVKGTWARTQTAIETDTETDTETHIETSD